jgi:ADP-ribosyl-[dinitrogen reductase] hydrolase
LLGTAAGDALGLPFEGLSGRRVRRLFADTSRHNLVFGHGMVSDDTEHAAFVARALVRCGDDPDAFRRDLARSLRWWLAALPPGIGFATLRSIIKLWLGFPPGKSGVYSAGNGPAMRSAILGVAFGHDHEKLMAFVKASTRITHSDPKAYFAALAVAAAAIDRDSSTHRDWRAEYLRLLETLMNEPGASEFLELVTKAMRSAANGESVTQFAESIGSKNGISGYCYHTVPCVLQVWFQFADNFERGLVAIIRAGGDTDTAGAIFGAIVGARAGKAAIPKAWLSGIVDWPRSIDWFERLSIALAQRPVSDGSGVSAPAYFWPAVLPRNLVFLLIVLAHGFRRLLPPY